MEIIETTSHLSERFEVAFNQIHTVLKRLNPNEYSDAFMKLLTDSSRKHRYIQKFFYDLRQYAKLRNALVHEKVDIHTYIATPSLHTVQHIEKIAKLIMKPPTVLKIATRSVVTVGVTTSLEDIIKTMDSSSYNQLPVYENGMFSFLLTENGLTSWLASGIRSHNINLFEKTALDIQPFENEHNVAFVHQDMDMLELEDIYEEYFQNKKKLEAVIVTKTGSPLEKPLGIITPWDLIEIDLIQEDVSNVNA